MNLAKIPNDTDIVEAITASLPASIISNDIPRLIIPDFTQPQHQHHYKAPLFPEGSPYLSKYILFNETEIDSQLVACRANGLSFYKNHNIMDEFYHYITGYRYLPTVNKQNLITRLQHPSVQYSLITQYLVTRYKSTFGVTETRALINTTAETPWYTAGGNDSTWYPINHWKNIYDRESHQRLGEEISLSVYLTRLLARNPFQGEVTTASLVTSSQNFLKPYSTKATSSFSFKYGKTPAYRVALGVELELDRITPTAIPILEKYLGKHAIFKRDGSVSNGVEICTAPATLDIHKETFKAFFENEAIQKSGLQATTNCGLHVHVDRAKLKQTQIAKILMFMNNNENNTFIEHIAGRQANTYCNKEEHTWETTVHKTSGTKYSRVNLAPEKTIEFRLFASTLNNKQFNRCLEFVQAIVDYTQSGEHDCSVKDMLKKENFILYTDKHKHFYPDLHEFLHPKIVKKTNKTKTTGVTL